MRVEQRFHHLSAIESLVFDSCFIGPYSFDCVDLLLRGEAGTHWVVWEKEDYENSESDSCNSTDEEHYLENCLV